MSKYGSGLDIVDVCKMELEELGAILEEHGVAGEDRKAIEGMLIEAYYQLTEAHRAGRILETILKEYEPNEVVINKKFLAIRCKQDEFKKKFYYEILEPRDEE